MPPKRKIGGEMASKPAAAKKKAYGMAPVMPAGETLTDFNKKQWVLGKSFASGGFGRIYYAKPTDSLKNAKDSYVIKMEPAENGPLFQEFHVYTRIGKPDMIERYKNSKGLKFLGVPAYFGCGLHKKDGLSHRFLVLPRLGMDLEKIRESQPNQRFSNVSDVARLALTCLDAYEYLHTNHTVHADLKGENLLLVPDCSSSSPANLHKCYLVDYGLARKVSEHPVYKEQPKKAHDGTLIFTSLDAHKGCAPVYRGDVEILGYNLIFWLRGSLPWSNITKPEQVLASKAAFAANVKKALRIIFGEKCPFVNSLSEFFDVCYSTDYAHRPDYAKLRQILQSVLKLPSRKSVGKSLSSSSDSRTTTRNGLRPRENEMASESYSTARSSGAAGISAASSRTTRGSTASDLPHSSATASNTRDSHTFVRQPIRTQQFQPIYFEKEGKQFARARTPSDEKKRRGSSLKRRDLRNSVTESSHLLKDDCFTDDLTTQSSSAEDLNSTDVDLFDPPPPPKPSSSKIRQQSRRGPPRKAAPIFFETEDETEEDEGERSAAPTERPKPAPAFKVPEVPPTPPRRSVVPGAVNLDRKCRVQAAAAASPLKPFRRRESVEAALLKKYRRFQASTAKKSKTFGGEYSSTTEETDEDSSDRPPALRTKNVETQTSPAISDKWLALRQQKQRR